MCFDCSLFKYLIIQDSDILIRILASIILGSIIGLEREITHKSAGLRTQILVCLGSCIFTILSIYGFSTAVTLYPLGDPSRVAAQIVTGIGFIGAGTVLRQGLTITGLTTASTLWIGAAIGMACGCGQINIAAASAIIAAAVLVLIRMFEYRLLPSSKRQKKIKISFLCTEEDYQTVCSRLDELFPDIAEFTHKSSEDENYPVKVSLKIFSKEKNPVMSADKKLSALKNIYAADIKEFFD